MPVKFSEETGIRMYGEKRNLFRVGDAEYEVAATSEVEDAFPILAPWRLPLENCVIYVKNKAGCWSIKRTSRKPPGR